MSFILGIDTGGTYTDAVLVDKDDKNIITKAKAFTTYEDLTIGITKCIDMMDIPCRTDICEVNISTTLAVNSILERRFEKIGLLQVNRAIDTEPPAHYDMVIKNPFSGKQKLNYLDKLSEIKDIKKTFSGNVDYIVISSQGGAESQWCEHQLAEIIRRELDVDVFCASDHSDIEDYTCRTIHAMFTIYLRPIVERWIKSIEKMMKSKGINADIKIVNAMGKLISCEDAVRNPLSTLFSGLASSVKGGLGLTELNDFLLVDMGGTSCDITRIINREFREIKEWTKIDEFRIKENTMDVQTFGAGGDSHIRITQTNSITVGPQKAIPICVMGSKYRHLAEELEACKRPDNYEMVTVQDVDCFIGVRGHNTKGLTDFEIQIVEYLMEEPHNVFVISEHFKRDPDALHLDKLVRKGALKLISVTPTDILHAEKKYTEWDVKCSDIAVKHMARQLKVGKNMCIQRIKGEIFAKLIRACMQSIASFEKNKFDFEESPGAGFMLSRFYGNEESMLDMKFKINKPIVALGAPSGAWLKQVGEKLDTEVIVPEHGDVANAYGAAIAE